MKPIRHLAAGMSLALLAAGVSHAQDTPAPAAPAATPAPAAPESPRGEVERGADLAYTCTGCHGVTGYKNAYPNYHVPRIGGQNEDYIVAALHEYREGRRNHPTMRAQAESFSDQDIADIAAYLSSLGGGAR
ncbi:c-type cytochrome [Coralloluteibacterium stylophorae]|uniref:Cytochrome c n=1 Tax=Coralloluteibacterium stylophorae TaxID=1776034 RepID=A0A8J8AYX8_9GAMM|nr:cytochrome c [Coralloluteibacterium stylophorae]MBS7455990.1 cytochrome c [Coralloluteibacterium stylophorae]